MTEAKKPLMTGSEVGIEFTYEDGSTMYYGSWKVPNSMFDNLVSRIGEELGYAIVYEMAKQPTRTVVGVRIVHRPTTPGGS